MNSSSVFAALEASLARQSATPCTWREDRDVYIDEQKQALRASLIEPVAVTATASDWAQKHAACDNEERSYVAVARSGDTWLLYAPHSGEFAKAFGPGGKAPLSLLGFASTDALAEWLG